MKKRKGGSKDGNSALSSAVKDLQGEIKRLNKEKGDLKRNLDSVSSSIDVDRERERQLQQRIAALLEKEAELNKKKKNLQTKIDKVSDRANKISKIKAEMADI